MVACSSSKKTSIPLSSAHLKYNKYIELKLKGESRLASAYFDKVAVSYIKLDRMCDLSRLYISKYIFNLPEKDSKVISIAYNYAKSGKCNNEENILNYLAGKDYDIDKLEIPFKIYASYKKNNNIEILFDGIDNDELTDYAKTRLIRYTVKQIIDKDIDKADELIKQAKEIDSFNGWTALIYKDLLLMKQICSKSKTDCVYLDKRIELISNILLNK